MQCNSILIVEDDPDIREAIELALQDAGYFVFTAEHGGVAQEMLKKIPGPCLVLLDLMMPVMSGWEFVAQQTELKKAVSAQASTFQVVVLTALPAGNVWQTAELSNAAVGYIRKPFDLDQLLEIVAQYCKPAHLANVAHLADWTGKAKATPLLRA
ncbi:MAG: response regulator [Methylotenera sp.]|nr:response regulator [Oligoflexia bacterium]